MENFSELIEKMMDAKGVKGILDEIARVLDSQSDHVRESYEGANNVHSKLLAKRAAKVRRAAARLGF